jgi:raffinose/stachyose/melibiose transport system substrate-binding protein
MKKGILRVIAILALFTFIVLAVTACGAAGSGGTTTTAVQTSSEKTATSEPTPEPKKAEPVTITVTTWSFGTDASATWWSQMVDGFKAKFGDQITLDVQEIPGGNYDDKIKVLLSSDQLPDYLPNYGTAYIDLVGGDLDKKFVDLTPYFDANPDFKACFDQATLDFNSRNGKVYGIPYSHSMMGYFYNKELFTKAGIAEPAKTWDEFWQDCDKLKAAGIAPLSIDTEGWPTTLLAGALIGSSGDEGLKFMTTPKPLDYNQPFVVDAFKKVQMAFQKYTTKDAVGNKYDQSENNFLMEKTAIFFNGPWMLADIKDPNKTKPDFNDKVGVAIYPADTAYCAPGNGDYICSKTKEKADASWQLMMFAKSLDQQVKALDLAGITPVSPNIVIPDSVKQKQPLFVSLLDMATKAKNHINDYQGQWYPNVCVELGKLYPELALGKITPKDFCTKLTEAAQKNK